MKLYTDVVEGYLDFARYAAPDSATFEAWANGVAGDAEVCAWIAELPAINASLGSIFNTYPTAPIFNARQMASSHGP